ncbi:hypothetical protein BX666DRAFT_430788 [Dichotomocladium elegans]|nr:hypothetical protein BX666DRAFT_430788 [Dichotomocladium elegans]
MRLLVFFLSLSLQAIPSLLMFDDSKKINVVHEAQMKCLHSIIVTNMRFRPQSLASFSTLPQLPPFFFYLLEIKMFGTVLPCKSFVSFIHLKRRGGGGDSACSFSFFLACTCVWGKRRGYGLGISDEEGERDRPTDQNTICAATIRWSSSCKKNVVK